MKKGMERKGEIKVKAVFRKVSQHTLGGLRITTSIFFRRVIAT
jgi:hypothetical protein